MWAHSSVWIEWLPAEQLVEGSNPSGPKWITMLFYFGPTNRLYQLMTQIAHNTSLLDQENPWQCSCMH